MVTEWLSIHYAVLSQSHHKRLTQESTSACVAKDAYDNVIYTSNMYQARTRKWKKDLSNISPILRSIVPINGLDEFICFMFSVMSPILCLIVVNTVHAIRLIKIAFSTTDKSVWKSLRRRSTYTPLPLLASHSSLSHQTCRSVKSVIIICHGLPQ